MPKSKEQKSQVIEKLAEKMGKAKVIVFSAFSQRGKKGLDMNAMREFKANLKKVNAEYTVAKKTLIRLALEKSSNKDLVDAQNLEGSVGLLFGYEDTIEPLKILYKLSKGKEGVAIYTGISEKRLIPNEEIIELANLPSRDILIGQMISMVRWPLSGLVNVLQGNLRSLVFVLNQKVAISK